MNEYLISVLVLILKQLIFFPLEIQTFSQPPLGFFFLEMFISKVY